MDVKAKKFVLIPRDAFELMTRRYESLAAANDAASQSCGEDGMTVYVVQLCAVASRADRPVKITKL